MVLAGTELYRDLGRINNIIRIYILIINTMVKYPTKHTKVQLYRLLPSYTHATSRCTISKPKGKDIQIGNPVVNYHTQMNERQD